MARCSSATVPSSILPPAPAASRSGCLCSLPLLRKHLLVNLRLEADDDVPAKLEHRPLDERRMRKHERDRLHLAERELVLLGQLAERRAGAVEQRLPADLAH